MQHWQEEFRKKCITAQQAAGMIKDNDRIMTGNRDCRAILCELVKRQDLHGVYYYEPICNFMPDTESVGQGFRPATSFLNESSHALQRAGRLDFIPAEYWLYHKIGLRALACNVSFLEVSKPDEHGFMSMGTCTDFARGACADAQLVIVETNSNFPFVPGSNLIHVSEVDYIVDADAENYVMVSPGTDIDEESLPTYKAIGGYLSELIPDEATIEVGLGRLNAASLMYLAPKRDLGVHTEVFGDILMHLTETGVITNLKKSEKRGRSVFTQVSGTEDIASAATISAGDAQIGKLIAEAMEKVSADGVITVEESKTAETYSEVVEGMQFDRGYITPYMVTDTEKMEAVVDDAYILITDKKISNIQEILPLLEQIVKAGKKLVIIADEVEGEALATILLNKLRGTFTCVCVKAPAFGDRRKETMQDIAVLTGGQVVSGDYGMELKDATFDMLGRARQVKVSKENTIIVGGAGTKEAIADRVAQIKNQYEVSTSDYDREKLMERLARLSGGVAVIKVGAATEAEMKEKKLRVEDALNATKAAVEEGIVAGGGTAYVQAGIAAEKVVTELEGDEKTGAAIVAKALQAPLMQIAANAGLEGAVILNQVRGSEIPGYGFDAAKEEYCDMIAAGIVDPTKVCRSALENAASVASTVLTTEAMVVSIPDPPAPAPAAPDMGGMY